MDTEQDLAFISVPKLPLAPLNIGTNATAGSLVTFMGYPKGGPFKALPATVQGIGNTQTIDADTGAPTLCARSTSWQPTCSTATPVVPSSTKTATWSA